VSEVVTVSGEIIPMGAQLTPAQASERAAWVREMRKAVLTEGTDYARLPGTDRPTLLKPGAEMLLMASGLGFTMSKVQQGDAGPEGVTYKASVKRGEQVVAECEGFAGYDESRFYRPAVASKAEYRAPWNTLVKMAQKRALVGAALNATAASGIFIADLDDERDTHSATRQRAAPRRAPAGRRDEGPDNANDVGLANGVAELEARLMALDLVYRNGFKKWRQSAGLDWPPATLRDFATMAAEVGRIEEAAQLDSDTYDS
jgi:hypothetical protein